MINTERETALFEEDENVLVITRRLFDTDDQRHFIGTVERSGGSAIRVRGHAYVYDTEMGEYTKRKGQRIRVFPLDNHLIVFVLAPDTNLAKIRYEQSNGELTVTDGKACKLELHEFSCDSENA